MSAYVVTDFHINGLVTWAAMHNGNDRVSYYWEGRRRYIQDDEQRVASVLYAQNVRSVNSRYEESTSGHGFKFKEVLGAVMHHTPVEIIKACRCYSYQACGTDDWKSSEAFAVIEAIVESAVEHMPGYDSAAWGLREPEDAPQVISLFKLSKDIKAKRGQA